MPLSPIDVQQQTFKVALRGYAEDEVDEFLDEVVIALRDYEQRLRDAQERVAVLEEQLSANRETEDAMRRTFLVAQRTADTIVEEANLESERLLSGARGEVERVAIEQGEEKAQLLSETAMLRDRVHGLRASLKDLAGRTVDRLDALEVDAAADRISALAAPKTDPIVHPDPEPEIVSDEPIDVIEDEIDLAEGSAADMDFDDATDLGVIDQEGDESEQDEPEDAPAGDYRAETAFSDDEEVEEAGGSDDGSDEEYSDDGEFDDDDDDDDDIEDDIEDDADPEDDVEIAKVPDWMTRDDSSTEESVEEDSRPSYRRPWERDED